MIGQLSEALNIMLHVITLLAAAAVAAASGSAADLRKESALRYLARQDQLRRP